MNPFMMNPLSDETDFSEGDDHSEVDDVHEVDELGMWEHLEEKKQQVMEEKKRLEFEIERLEQCQKEAKGRRNGYRAQAVSTFHRGTRQAVLPVHRCPTEAEASMPHYPVVRTSIELLKVVLHTMISTIFLSRGLLPLPSFGVRDLPICFSDEKFMFKEHFLKNGTEPEWPYPLQVQQGRIPVMERNKDEITDGILDYLENKFVESLMKRELLGLQFLIVKDPARPREVYETYTISIDYSGGRGCSDRRGEKPDFHDPKEDYKSSVKVKKAILDMFYHIYIVTNNITTLPKQRCLIFHTFHTPWAPESKNGDEYDLSWDDVLNFPAICGWSRKTVSSQFIDTGFFGATLSVTFMDPPESTQKANDDPIQVPTQIRFNDRQVRDQFMDWRYGTKWVDDEVDKRVAAKEAAAKEAAAEEAATEEPTPKLEEPTTDEFTPEERKMIELWVEGAWVEEDKWEARLLMEEHVRVLRDASHSERTGDQVTIPTGATKRAAAEEADNEGPQKKAKTAVDETTPKEVTPEKATTPNRATKRAAEEDDEGPRKKAKTAPEETAAEATTLQEPTPNESAPGETAVEEPKPEEPRPEKRATPERAVKRAVDGESDYDRPRKKMKRV